MENQYYGIPGPANRRVLFLPEDIRGRLLEGVKKGEVSAVDSILSTYELLPADSYLMVSLAARRNQLDMVKFLIIRGCPINMPSGMTFRTNTPYDYAVLHGNQAMQRLLLETGADPKFPNPVLDYPKDCIDTFFEIVKKGNVSAAAGILSRFRLLPEDGYLMIGVAAKSDNLDMAKLLLRHGVPVNEPDTMTSVTSGIPTPLSQAVLNNSQPMERLLLDNGAVM